MSLGFSSSSPEHSKANPNWAEVWIASSHTGLVSPGTNLRAVQFRAPKAQGKPLLFHSFWGRSGSLSVPEADFCGHLRKCCRFSPPLGELLPKRRLAFQLDIILASTRLHCLRCRLGKGLPNNCHFLLRCQKAPFPQCRMLCFGRKSIKWKSVLIIHTFTITINNQRQDLGSLCTGSSLPIFCYERQHKLEPLVPVSWA